MRDPAEAEALLANIDRHAAAGTLFQWGIAERDNDLVIGTCTLFRIEAEHRRAEIGYILRRDHWGLGLAHEALTALFDHSFSVMRLHRLEADIDPRNARSIRVIYAWASVLEGTLARALLRRRRRPGLVDVRAARPAWKVAMIPSERFSIA